MISKRMVAAAVPPTCRRDRPRDPEPFLLEHDAPGQKRSVIVTTAAEIPLPAGQTATAFSQSLRPVDGESREGAGLRKRVPAANSAHR